MPDALYSPFLLFAFVGRSISPFLVHCGLVLFLALSWHLLGRVSGREG